MLRVRDLCSEESEADFILLDAKPTIGVPGPERDEPVIFLGLILLASKTKRGGVWGPSPGKFFILRWLKPHFFYF